MEMFENSAGSHLNSKEHIQMKCKNLCCYSKKNPKKNLDFGTSIIEILNCNLIKLNASHTITKTRCFEHITVLVKSNGKEHAT